jgi:hypothetical protein
MAINNIDHPIMLLIEQKWRAQACLLDRSEVLSKVILDFGGHNSELMHTQFWRHVLTYS